MRYCYFLSSSSKYSLSTVRSQTPLICVLFVIVNRAMYVHKMLYKYSSFRVVWSSLLKYGSDRLVWTSLLKFDSERP